MAAPQKRPFSRKLVVSVFKGEERLLSKAFDQGPVILGRQPGCDLILEYPVISRMHCQVLEEGGNLFLVDLGSRNGVVVDGRNCGKEKTAVNDQLNFQIEPLRFELRVVGQVQVPAKEGSYETVVIPRPSQALFDVKPSREKTSSMTPGLPPIPSASSPSPQPLASAASHLEIPEPYTAPTRPQSLIKQISELIVARVKSSPLMAQINSKLKSKNISSEFSISELSKVKGLGQFIPQQFVVPLSIAAVFIVGLAIGISLQKSPPSAQENHQVDIPPVAPPAATAPAVTEVEKAEEPTPVAALPPPEAMPVIPEMNNPEMPIQPTQVTRPESTESRVAKHAPPTHLPKKIPVQNAAPVQKVTPVQKVAAVDNSRQTIKPQFQDPLSQNGPLVHKAPTVIVMKGAPQRQATVVGTGLVRGKNDPNGPQIQLRKAGSSQTLPQKTRAIATASVGTVVNIKPGGGLEGLSPLVVMKNVNLRRNAIQQCYNQSLQGGADVSGYIDVQWKIEADGRVSGVRIQKNALGGGGVLANCLKTVVQKIHFPLSSNRKPTIPIARFPFGSTRSAGSERP